MAYLKANSLSLNETPSGVNYNIICVHMMIKLIMSWDLFKKVQETENGVLLRE